ncbi:hypothetical protein [Aquibium microcysteis]|uniref:hypothetical protein n=1 Tax=Aquibium microcysteis TaxID=675281 RepID=UPI00165CF5EF|nr:hypothetical protein [Aquibium microcysteis]
MPDREKDTGRRDATGEGVAAGRKADRRDRQGQADGSPFHGALHSDPPHDPFRRLFAGSSLKFEF